MNGRIVISAFVATVACVCQACSQPRNNLVASARPAVREQQVQFRNGSVTLAGTLFLPSGEGRHPAVVLFHGSGSEARNTFMAHWFAEQGVAALTYDKRGVGASTGDYREVAFLDLCGDGLAGMKLLEARADILPKQIGVWGLSQGGWLGPLAAAHSKDVAFVIAVSGPGVSPGEQMIFYYGSELRAKGLSEPQIEEASTLRRRVWHYLATGDGYEEAKAALERGQSRPWYAALQAQNDGLFASSESAILDDPALRSRSWFKVEMNYDPTIALRRLSVPALFLFGERDELVPVAKSVEIIRGVLIQSGHPDFTIRTFPEADHGIRVTAPDGTTRLAPGYLDTMRDWLRRRVAVE
jgi:pimeloyl-ACP methyl ester carboxylesterase